MCLRVMVGMRQWARTGLGHEGITCVLQTEFSSSINTLPKKFENISCSSFKTLSIGLGKDKKT